MGVKKTPSTLFNLTLRAVAKTFLIQWKRTYYSDCTRFSEDLKSKVGILIPFTIYGQIFDLMVESYAIAIQNSRTSDGIPSIPALLDCIIIPNLQKLSLKGLRYIKAVKYGDIRYLENILTSKLPNLKNLTELSLLTSSGTDLRLPTCNDDILYKVGSSCPKLITLDVSNNRSVTDIGLQHLLPSDTHAGCPDLITVTIFECYVTTVGVAVLIKGLPRLKFLGYKETGQSLMHLYKRTGLNCAQKLELSHINNLGSTSRTSKDLLKLKCNYSMASTISYLCPKLNSLKVRLNDSEVKFLQQLTSVSVLELVFNLGTPSSPGSNTVNFLQLQGAQFMSLSFVCDNFNIQSLKVVCEQCSNLKRLWIHSNTFTCDQDIILSDRKKCSLTNLEVFFFRVGHTEPEYWGYGCSVPQSVLHYILHKSNCLTEIVLVMKNDLICDVYAQELFQSIQTTKIKTLMMLVPNKNVTGASLNLSMSTVESLIGMCPQLEQLGNMLVWDVSLEEIQELRRQLKISNSALVTVYKMAFSAGFV